MSNHVQHVIKIFQALPLLISFSVKGRGRAWLEATKSVNQNLAIMTYGQNNLRAQRALANHVNRNFPYIMCTICGLHVLRYTAQF